MKKLAILALVGFLGLGTANATIMTYAGPGAVNVDTDPATMVSFNIADTGSIADLNVAVNITGNHVEDFTVSISHNGIDAILINPNVIGFGHRDIFDVLFDDESANAVVDGGDLIGDYVSLDLLSIFDGEDIFGTWTLSILDDFTPNEGNSLITWSIIADVNAPSQVPEPGILVLLGMGLLGLGVSRKAAK